MKTVKHTLYILILYMNSTFGQTLNVSDFRKLFNNYKPIEHKELFSKGFDLLNDTISTNQKKFKFRNQQAKEIIEITFVEDGEGSTYLSIIYFVPTEFAYKKFISTLIGYKFKYSKRNKRYQLPTSSYSGENISLKGLTQTDGKQYYSLKYDCYVDKAFSGLRPEFSNDKIPIVDKTIKPE